MVDLTDESLLVYHRLAEILIRLSRDVKFSKTLMSLSRCILLYFSMLQNIDSPEGLNKYTTVAFSLFSHRK